MSELLSELEQKKAADRIYNWLRGLSVISVPWFLWLVLNMNFQSSTIERFWAAALPASPYLLYLLLTGTSTNHIFVKRHARQGLAIVFLRFFTAFLSTGFRGEAVSGLPFFLIANGLLWFFGSSTGKLQVDEGDGMFVRQSERLSTRSIKDLEKAEVEEPAPKRKITRPEMTAIESFAQGEQLLNRGNKLEAVRAFTTAFRKGDAQIRGLAARQLNALDEVEEF